jgi:alkaline phosphatase D
MECLVSGGDRNIFLLTKELKAGDGDLRMSVSLGRLNGEREPLSEGFVGFRLGIKGSFHDYRDSAIYGSGLNAGIDSQGRVFVGSPGSNAQSVEGFPRDIQLDLQAQPANDGYRIHVSALDQDGRILGSALQSGVDRSALMGGLALVCSAGPIGSSASEPVVQTTMNGLIVPARTRQGNWRFWFQDWRVAGSKVTEYPEREFGPILWTMYTVSRGVLKLSAQMAPVGDAAKPVHLEIRYNGTWRTIWSANIDPLARTATFRIQDWNSRADVEYRVVYRMQREYTFEGIIRKDPVDKPKFVLAALSCLNDFGFPHRDLLESIQHFEPDLVAFQGDQIYERVAGYGIQRFPLEPAVLDYLRKWYLFGWAFRDLLRSTPSVCQTDDHDMYHGNIWGAGGRHAEGSGQDGQDSGGYLEPAAWVNTVQRAQTSHLPDPYDPSPVEQDIGVYYTDLVWGGISFAILEDRKWKSPPRVLLPQAQIRNGWAQNPHYDAARDGDAPGAELLGARQLKFLDHWAGDWKGGIWMKVALTQTLLANVATMPPPANTDAVDPTLPILKPSEYPEHDVLVADHDSNGWPQSGRNRALESFRRCAALHVCGDQHLGSTIQNGVDNWRDAAVSFCSPALSNIFPRRWFPPYPGRNPLPSSPRNTGDYLDGFGNKVTVHAVFNPEQSGEQPNHLMDRSPGFGIIEFERARREITISLWPRIVDPRSPTARAAKGWPIRIAQMDNGWSSCAWELPPVRASGRNDFCVEVRAEGAAQPLYTLRIKGDSFSAPVREPGIYSVRVFDPDEHFEQTHAGLRARRV